ncbi:4Fe-4S cluster-binding domain-containing protein [candidate division WWE3 bacterium]|uniref:4Fe-4S cluster-binding domain-containing protein n=1 Tax=candidate division WWE3 bacterium TaxID=2053526 RepID=A0A7X9HI26_UNCKA|nr:4Fe-4S cluster-binding domain-containing protein [candidate division WWE3 bacterium]
MRVKDIIDEDFVNYKDPSMFIATCFCTWKCPKELGIDISICQNEPIAKMPNIEMPVDEIFHRYSQNPITSAIVIGGLEPMLQFKEVIELIKYFRERGCDDTFVIYTGYYPQEVQEQISQFKQFKNIVIKFGRYQPNQKPHLDEVLGVNLISDNQYAEQIS